MKTNTSEPQPSPSQSTPHNILGKEIHFPEEWAVFSPCDVEAPLLEGKELIEIPGLLVVDGKSVSPTVVRPERCQFDFKPFFGEPSATAKAAYIFLNIESPKEQDATIGLGADYYTMAWLNGEAILDTLLAGNGPSPCSITDHQLTVHLKSGVNVLALYFINGRGPAVVALGGPEDLRRDDFVSIVPPRKKVVDAQSLYEMYPPEPEAVVSWEVPETFNPTLPDLGLPPLPEAEHAVIFEAQRSGAALDDGGEGAYESPEHGTWNHTPQALVFGDHLIVQWQSHARDEHGPGARILGRRGRILDEAGQVDWGRGEKSQSIVEIAPSAVMVDRRIVHGTIKIVRNVNTCGLFHVVEDRLFFFGNLSALYGKAMVTSAHWDHGTVKIGKMLPDSDFDDVLGPRSQGGINVRWDLGVQFCQEWAVIDDCLQPVSPLFRSADLPTSLAMTAEIVRPVVPANPQFISSPLVHEAPEDVRRIFLSLSEARQREFSGYKPGTRSLTCDGTNGLAHFTDYQRPDGTWVTIRENQKPKVQPVYYASERADRNSFYPPARRTNLFGAANPAAGSLPDGRTYLIGNSPNRRTMFITLSKDGRRFDRTWFLLHRQLADVTPGAMKGQGGPRAGPQYFVSQVVGRSLWIAYSISKEHIGVTRIPLASLAP